MKTSYKPIFSCAALLLLLTTACDEKENSPISDSKGTPGQVSSVEVTPVAGGAIVNYIIPDDEDVLGVKAVYTMSNGKQVERQASFYDNSITLDGFIDEETHSAKLYTFNRAMQLSQPVEISFIPLESALSKACKSMHIVRDFGGAQFSWKNEDRGQLNLELIATDSIGRLSAMRVITTQSADGLQTLHGYNTDPRWFCALFRDNFGNVSDTIFPTDAAGNRIQLSPLYEEKIDKKLMSIMLLNTDEPFSREGMDAYLIDDDLNTYGHTKYTEALPAAVTIDLGQEVKVSRIVVNAREYGGSYYSWGNPREFDLYSCSQKPSQTGDWSEWNEIMHCIVVKPSGMTGQDTDEDMEAGRNGAEFPLPLEADPTRYLRLNITRIWTNNQFCHIAEITVYGDPNI